MKKASNGYQTLHSLSRHSRILQGIQSLLEWDQETYMPSEGSGIRAEQLKALAGLIHKEKTSKKFASTLNKLINIKTGKILRKDLLKPQEAALRAWKRDYRREVALPGKFVEDFAKLTSEAKHAWIYAKKQQSFEQFCPYLEKIVSMCRHKADLIGYKEHPYDALLEEFEPGITTSEVATLFQSLQISTLKLLKKIRSAKQIQGSFLHQNVSEKDQMLFSQTLLKLIGYTKEHGRLDISAHPFSSSSHPTDSRITTRIDPSNFVSNIRTVLHECGHAFYEMGLPIDNYGSPLGEAISLGVHESQSRWWETLVGMSKPFWRFCLPHLKKHLKGKLDGVSVESFWIAINKVEPSLIRVEADEVTYALHVILRFELELALIEGSLLVKKLPEAWNEKMHTLLGISPKNHAEGCLQDVHWSFGAFGYFPTYTLGNMYAAHLFQGFEKTFPKWSENISNGEFLFMKNWLKENIHQHGRAYSSLELLKNVTGKPFTAKAFSDYLTNKYHAIYNIH
ncbi:MAG TPA: carboxypeptidase M32 [Waddliaceae bacterium]